VATTWPETAQMSNASSLQFAENFEEMWLYSFLKPLRVTHDKEGEFIGQDFQELLQSYVNCAAPTTVKKTQEKALVNRVHLTMGNILLTSTFKGK